MFVMKLIITTKCVGVSMLVETINKNPKISEQKQSSVAT